MGMVTSLLLYSLFIVSFVFSGVEELSKLHFLMPPLRFPSLSLISSASYNIRSLAICVFFLAWLKLRSGKVNVLLLLKMFLEVPD